ncbi:hypothetical protein AMATHDRAFT_134848 [Amanita thiersii Skay4041]|uniref:AB hydrolase-1 domain-containing protein n=1 Tax=Amanita thiersii Skay4041 TaxID=703135 RepID=A0A2A9P140_9AGAR|nr:hypothetical protein AMATHDRAFT_134848 [Amanita thiersii Skay4041]
MLPPFLSLPHPSPSPSSSPFYDTIFHHPSPIGPIRCLWWPSKSKRTPPSFALLFIPGNPGILDFYTQFLTAIHEKDTTSSFSIFAHSHIGHSPQLDQQHSSQYTNYSLTTQVESALQAFDAITSFLEQPAKIVIIGHSVGAWIALQVLKHRFPNIKAVFLLFPTITHISQTPNGVWLSHFFTPLPRYLISTLSHFTRLIPHMFLSMIFGSWPAPHILALRTLLNSPQSIRAAMTMAHDEMHNIVDLDVELLKKHRELLYFYFAEKDDWVGEYKGMILEAFKEDIACLRVTDGMADIPHAFCISELWRSNAINGC